MLDPLDVVHLNREQALRMVDRMGVKPTVRLLEEAARDLEVRMGRAEPGTFTSVHAEATLRQVKDVLSQLTAGMRDTMVDATGNVTELAVDNVVGYMSRADAEFRGAGTQPLALDDAEMFSRASQGARSSLLNRLVRGPHAPEGRGAAAKGGILRRYGENTVEQFETILQRGVLARKSRAEMQAEITAASPFLQKAPAHWAVRIVRTELMGAYGRAGWEATREADDQLGDVVKILSAVFDNRTAADSYAVHGQIRLPEEMFQTWQGEIQHPPSRPNDREIVVSHRISWVLPKYLRWKTDSEVADRWHKFEKRKQAPPPRPLMTTVDIERFGADFG